MMLRVMLPCPGGGRPVRCEKTSLLRIRVKTERPGFPGPLLAINVQENLPRMAYLWNYFIACGDCGTVWLPSLQNRFFETK